MSGRVLRFDDPAHRQSEALLPWLVNGTLDGAERSSVEQHVAQCPRCQREIESLREMQAAYNGSAMVPDVARSLSKLRRRMAARSGWRAGVDSARRFWRRTEPWACWTVAAQLAVIVVLGALLSTGSMPPLYRTLSSDAAPASVEARRGADAVIVFDPRVSEAELRRIVGDAHAQIVHGPTEAGGYLLALPAAGQAAALAALRRESGVQMVEPLAAEGGH